MGLNRNKMRKLKGILLLLLLPGLAIVTGCKITYSFTGASTQGLSTFSVQYFQNRAPVVQPSLAQNLTDALIDKCRSQTNLNVVRGTGDANFEGEITDYSTRPQAIAADAQAALNRFTITVRVKYTNAADPELSFDQTFSRYEDYSSDQDLSQVEGDLTTKIIDMLVEDIFNQAFVNW